MCPRECPQGLHLWLRALTFAKVSLKLSYFCKKTKSLNAGGSAPKPLCLPWLEALPLTAAESGFLRLNLPLFN